MIAEGLTTDIARAWADALAPVLVRHPDPTSEVEIALTDQPATLTVAVLRSRDTTDPANVRRLVISCVDLTYFPGARLARQWLAAAWAGYIQHEALELVTVGDLHTRPIDPHADPSLDRGLRHGFPVALTPFSLLDTLCLVMPAERALELVDVG